MLQDARRAGPLHKVEDPRVDVAVYFIAPHRLKQMDCQFMAELSKVIPVLPVLAKARAASALLTQSLPWHLHTGMVTGFCPGFMKICGEHPGSKAGWEGSQRAGLHIASRRAD